MGENMAELLIRTNRTLKSTLSDIEAKYEPWDARYVQLRLEWGGHVARLGAFDPARLTYHVLSHWSYDSIKHIADQSGGKQFHGRHLHVWRWEYYMYKLISRDWLRAAYDRDEWKHITEAKSQHTIHFSQR